MVTKIEAIIQNDDIPSISYMKFPVLEKLEQSRQCVDMIKTWCQLIYTVLPPGYRCILSNPSQESLFLSISNSKNNGDGTLKYNFNPECAEKNTLTMDALMKFLLTMNASDFFVLKKLLTRFKLNIEKR